MIKVEKWSTKIISFECDRYFDNPVKDCIIKAEFTSPSNKILIREAYWDGEKTYRVSFALNEIGQWNLNVKTSVACVLNGVENEIECIEYKGHLEIYKHGFLKVSEDKKHFTFADGKAFFWLGDTHWEFAYNERWDESNHPEMTSMFKGMVDRRVEQGYNIYQTNLRSDPIMGGNTKYWLDNGLPNLDFYQNELDRRMYYLAEKGLTNALGFAWFMSIEENEERYKELVRYFIARYGSLPLVWTLAGEVSGYDKNKHTHLIDLWRSIALEIEKYDTYCHLQTAHYTNERPFPIYYQDESWYDFTLNQAGHGDYLVSYEDYRLFMREHGNKPFIEGEVFYEFCSTLEENGVRMCTDAMVRRAAYMSIQAGGCGFTYGAQGIWDQVWEKGSKNTMAIFNRYDITWYEAIDGPGGSQMGYMKKFYEEHKFWTTIPYDIADESTGDPFGKKRPFVRVSKDKGTWIFYYTELTRKCGVIQEFKNGIYTLKWFNPSTGQYKENDLTVHVENNTFQIPMKPDEKDWCLVVKESEGDPVVKRF